MLQVQSNNVVRARGVVGSIRSCLFDPDFHWWLVDEMDITTSLLLPLVVPEHPFTETEKEGMNPRLWMHQDCQILQLQQVIALQILKLLLRELLFAYYVCVIGCDFIAVNAFVFVFVLGL
jgi:hypothetical protein